MEYRNVLDKIFGQKTKVKILRYLVRSQSEQSGMRIAKATGINHWQCLKVLRDLYGQGVLKMRHAGNAYLFGLKENHYIVEKAIIPLFKVESNLIENMVEEIKNKLNIQKGIISSMVMFGSIAAGKEKPHSDIDILVLIMHSKDKEKIVNKIMKHNEYFLAHYGNTLSPYVVTEAEFVKRHKKRDKLIENIIKSGRPIYGKTIGEIITQ